MPDSPNLPAVSSDLDRPSKAAPVRVPFGPRPTQVLDLETAAEVLRLLHEHVPGVLSRYIGIAITGHEPGAKERSTRGRGDV